ncbi:hypothetical protein Goarm_020254 [Gossypium armourianum]|uniref:Uncharacterized protein n=1 Tax=Gossypium armourianum TaxID=34283 RepID=A0A7J9IN22_9ROSI|nr:hypothetical protein [Gossypium armourianum]
MCEHLDLKYYRKIYNK